MLFRAGRAWWQAGPDRWGARANLRVRALLDEPELIVWKEDGDSGRRYDIAEMSDEEDRDELADVIGEYVEDEMLGERPPPDDEERRGYA